MNTNIFVNLAVKNLDRSMEFFKQIGFSFNLQFTDETAACMVISESIYVMLLTEIKFQQFTPKNVCDTSRCTEALVALSCESRARVDELVRLAVAAGGSIYRDPEDYGFMYGHGFQDLDGHLWELFYMEPGAAQQK